MNYNDSPARLVADEQRGLIDRKVIGWLNACPFRGADVTTEGQMALNRFGLGVSSVSSAFVSRAFILGGYQAEYSFTLICRVCPGGSLDASLQANELLNKIGGWASEHLPDLGDGIRVRKVSPVSLAETFAQYENGDEDHHISIKILYEVF